LPQAHSLYLKPYEDVGKADNLTAKSEGNTSLFFCFRFSEIVSVDAEILTRYSIGDYRPLHQDQWWSKFKGFIL
jgi:hypothetical protein